MVDEADMVGSSFLAARRLAALAAAIDIASRCLKGG